MASSKNFSWWWPRDDRASLSFFILLIAALITGVNVISRTVWGAFAGVSIAYFLVVFARFVYIVSNLWVPKTMRPNFGNEQNADFEQDPNQVMDETVGIEKVHFINRESAWSEWSKSTKGVTEIDLSLLKSAFEAGFEVGCNACGLPAAPTKPSSAPSG